MHQRNLRRAARTTRMSRRRQPETGFFGIDFWHAVEFSRSGRAPNQAFRPGLGATLSNLLMRPCGCQTDFRPVPTRHATRPPRAEARGRGARAGGRPGTGHRCGVRSSLPGDVQNIRQSAPGNANPLVSGVVAAQIGPAVATGGAGSTTSTAARCACPAAARSQRPRQQVAVDRAPRPRRSTRTLLT